MNLSWFAKQNAELIALILFIVMMAAAEVGFRFGLRRHPKTDQSMRGYFNTAQGVVLTLMGLLLAFTFNMSAQRFDMRRQLVLNESNSLLGLYARGDILPVPQRTKFKELLRQYTDLRLSLLSVKSDDEAVTLQEAMNTSYKLQQGIWISVKESIDITQSKAIMDMIGPLFDTFAIQRSRVYAYEGRVPDIIMWMLMAAAVVVAASIGYSGGFEHHRGILANLLVALTVSCVIMVMLSLDRPRGRLLNVSQDPMIQARAIMNPESEGTQ